MSFARPGPDRAVATLFAVNGAVIATLVVRTPSVRLDHHLSATAVGLTATVFGVSALMSMQVAGLLVHRLGSGPVAGTASALLPFALIGQGLAPDLPALVAALVVLGSVHGVVDVTMNAHAVAVETALGRPVMNRCHAAWSIGAACGSVLGGLAAGRGLERWQHAVVLAVFLVPVVLRASAGLLPAAVDRGTRSGRRTVEPTRSRLTRLLRAGWTARIVALGLMGAAVLTCEAAVGTWSGVLLHETLGFGLGAASLGYVGFSLCQTGGRLVGDRLVTGFGAVRVVRTGCALAVTGLALVIAACLGAGRWTAVLGFAVTGIGLATPLPVVMSVAGHTARDGAATAVSRLTTLTYTGILVSPVVLGGLIDLVGMTATLAVLAATVAAVAAAAGLLGASEDGPAAAVHTTGSAVETPADGVPH